MGEASYLQPLTVLYQKSKTHLPCWYWTYFHLINLDGFLEFEEYICSTLEQVYEWLNSRGFSNPLGEICEILVRRATRDLSADIQLRYDYVEFPDGDFYAVASCSKSIASKEAFNSELKKYPTQPGSTQPSHSKIVEYLKRYEPALYSTLVAKKYFFDHDQDDFVPLEIFCNKQHPQSKAKRCTTKANQRLQYVATRYQQQLEAYEALCE